MGFCLCLPLSSQLHVEGLHPRTLERGVIDDPHIRPLFVGSKHSELYALHLPFHICHVSDDALLIRIGASNPKASLRW